MFQETAQPNIIFFLNFKKVSSKTNTPNHWPASSHKVDLKKNCALKRKVKTISVLDSDERL